MKTPEPEGPGAISSAILTRLDAALDYAGRGRRVFPLHSPMDGPDGLTCDCGKRAACGSPAKHPRTANGVKGASADSGAIRRWWGMWPNANIGLPTGDGLLAVDVDPRKGGDESIGGLGPLPDTVTSLTGGADGGRHLFYRVEGPTPSKTAILPGVDVRGDGGYIVAPPSRHISGRLYQWESGHAPGEIRPAPMPEAIAALLDGARRASDRADAPSDGGTIREGARNAALTSLGGTMRRRGMGEAAIEAALVAENAERCQPPLAESEVRAIAASVGRYEPAPEPVLPVTPPADEWPADAAEEAFHGLAGEIVRTLEPHTEADPHALLMNLLVAFGNAAGPRPHFRVGGDRHGLRLNAVLVGETSGGRKGQSWAEVRGLMEHADSDWAVEHVLTGLSTGEGLIWAVRDPIMRRDPIKEKGRVVGYEDVEADPGVTDKRLLAVESEFARTLRVAGRDGNTLSPVIRQAWDSGNLRVLTKATPARATGAHISIIGHVTQDELLRHLDGSEAANGFGNRFLWVTVRRSKALPEGGSCPPSALNTLIARLRDALDFAGGVAEMRRDDEARARWAAVYADLSAGRPGLFGALTARAEAQVMRLACLYALLDMSTPVQSAHLLAALALWERCEASVRYIFGDATGDPTADAILRALRAQWPLSQTAIYSDLFGRHRSAERIGKALALLAAAGLVKSSAEETGGRSATTWSAT